MDVCFKFKVKQWVKTPFGEMGIIGMCGVDDGPVNKYYVQMKEDCQWFDEDKLSLPTGGEMDKITLPRL